MCEQPARQKGARTFPFRAPADERSSAEGLALPSGSHAFALHLEWPTAALFWHHGARSRQQAGNAYSKWETPLLLFGPSHQEPARPAHHFAHLLQGPSRHLCSPSPGPHLYPPPLLCRNQTSCWERMVGSHSNGPFSCFHGNQHPDHLVASQLTAVSE